MFLPNKLWQQKKNLIPMAQLKHVHNFTMISYNPLNLKKYKLPISASAV